MLNLMAQFFELAVLVRRKVGNEGSGVAGEDVLEPVSESDQRCPHGNGEERLHPVLAGENRIELEIVNPSG